MRTVLVNNQGTQQLVTYHSASGAVTPGAAGEEVRVDCCLMNEDGRTVVTGSTLGPPQVWNMQVCLKTLHPQPTLLRAELKMLHKQRLL